MYLFVDETDVAGTEVVLQEQDALVNQRWNHVFLGCVQRR